LINVFSGAIHLYFRRLREVAISLITSLLPIIIVFATSSILNIQKSSNIANLIITEVGTVSSGTAASQFYPNYWFISGIAVTVLLLLITFNFGLFGHRYLGKKAFTPLILTSLILIIIQINFVLSFNPIDQKYDQPSYDEIDISRPIGSLADDYWKVPPPMHHSVIRNSIYNNQIDLVTFVESLTQNRIYTDASKSQTVCGVHRDRYSDSRPYSVNEMLTIWKRSIAQLDEVNKSNYSIMKSEVPDTKKEDIDNMLNYQKDIFEHYSNKYQENEIEVNSALSNSCRDLEERKEKLLIENYSCTKNEFSINLENTGKNAINESFNFEGTGEDGYPLIELTGSENTIKVEIKPREEFTINEGYTSVSRSEKIEEDMRLNIKLENSNLGFKFTCSTGGK
jgi:hypothetical protein